jgi:hypothetical protein
MDVSEKKWLVLCTARVASPWYFNVANLHYDWTAGEQTTVARRVWYPTLVQSVEVGLLKAYVDRYIPAAGDRGTFDVLFVEVERVDFRRRMNFRATRKGLAEYRRQIASGRSHPGRTGTHGRWVEETD